MPRAGWRTRVGQGGPQPTEVLRMGVEAAKALVADPQWVQQRRQQQAAADAKLNRAFAELLKR